jgi:glycosyltransferase involved in cell wall biosynthesis
VVLIVVNELCGVNHYLVATTAASLMGSSPWTKGKVVSMPPPEPTSTFRRALTLHGMSVDLRLDAPSSELVEYTRLPNIHELGKAGLEEDIVDIFLPIGLKQDLPDAKSLNILVRALLRMRKANEALEVMESNQDLVFLNRTLLIEYTIHSCKVGRYRAMERAISALEQDHGLGGVHSKILQALLISKAEEIRIDDYLEKMQSRYKHDADYEILRAAYNARKWDMAVNHARKLTHSSRNNFLAIRTFHRTNEFDSARQLLKKVKIKDYTKPQALELIRIGFQIGESQMMHRWLNISGLEQDEFDIEIARAKHAAALAEGDFHSAFDAFSVLFKVEPFTSRQILVLLRSNQDNMGEALSMLYNLGRNNPQMLSIVSEFSLKYNFLALGQAAFTQLESMALCSKNDTQLIEHYFNAAINSASANLLGRVYANLPYLVSKTGVVHEFGSYYEGLMDVLGGNPPSIDVSTDHIEAKLLNRIIDSHTSPLGYDPLPNHALIVNNSIKFGGAERQVVRCLSSNQFTKNLVVWNVNVNNPSNSFIEQVDGLGLLIYDYAVTREIEHKEFPQEIERILSYIPHSTPFNPGITSKIKNLTSIILQDRPTTLHLWQDTTSVLGAIAGLIAGVPKIVMSARSLPPFADEESTFPDKGPNYYFNNRFVRSLYRSLLLKENVFLCHNSENGRNKYIEWLGGFEDKMLLLRNGFDFSMSIEDVKVQSSDSKTVGVVFRFVEVKQPLLWLDVAFGVLEHRPNVRFKMVGDGPMMDAAMSHAKGLGISDSVDFLGYRDDVEAILPGFDVFLLTSAIEGLPNVLIEAQSKGIPVVSTNAGGASETFIDGVSGVLVDRDDATSLVEAVVRVLDDPSFSSNAQGKGRAFVQSTYSEDAMHQQLTEILFGE